MCGVRGCMFVCSHVFRYIYTHLQRPETGIRSLPPLFSIIHQVEVSQLSPDVSNMVNLTSQLALGSPYLGLPSTGITGRPFHPPGIYMSSRTLNSLPHSFRANAVSTETSPISFIFGLVGSSVFQNLNLQPSTTMYS